MNPQNRTPEERDWGTARIEKTILKELSYLKLELNLRSIDEVLRLLLETYRKRRVRAAHHTKGETDG